jgi:hypothetical protein
MRSTIFLIFYMLSGVKSAQKTISLPKALLIVYNFSKIQKEFSYEYN